MSDRPLVLVADDDRHILELVELALEHDGYDVVTALDGNEAVRLVRECRPRLCILDVMMPGMDGLEAARHLSDDETTARIPILFLTASDRATIATSGLPAGAQHYLQKPFNPAALRARVQAILSWEPAREGSTAG